MSPQGAGPDDGAKEAVQQHASQVTDQATSAAQQVKEQAREQIGSLGGEARERARGTLQDVRGQLQEHADGQAQKAAGSLHDFAGQLRSMSEGAEPGQAVDLTRQASERLEQFASRLEDGGTSGLIDDVSNFARQRPGVFLLGALGAGFAVGRLLRNVDLQAVKPSGAEGGPSTQSGGPSQGSLPSGQAQVGQGGQATTPPHDAERPLRART